jgi:peptide/nickel transport system permease protein
MLRFVSPRLMQGVVVIFLVSVTTFLILQLAPGNPIDVLVGEARVSEEQRQLIADKWGLNDPWYVQYFTWLGNVFTGDLGRSVVQTGTPVREMLLDAAPATIRLNLLALVVSTLIAIPVGVLAAVKRHSGFDYASMLGASLGISVPNYWIGLMLIVLFSLTLDWLPPYGSQGWQAYVLPVGVLAFQEMAILARLSRGATIEVLNQDYVNTLLPVVTILGYRVAFILSGTIVIETVFAWPGIGQLFFNSIIRLDYQVVQAIVLLLSTLVVVGNLLTDIAYAYIDPRIRIR